ncbi:nitrate regulatory gene2 protein-like [Trifolium pratense]|uniref:Uncharacterized protein n=1 Tax=Trifolium pratense TaxID=57577 RepID=A0ACB0L899_TRIPR|nr:nitrate regulatory gene2 protein-like [Trifolium pratense]CAJ2665030.1 unnamed protein product [Trifolium pratense]
MGCAASKLDNEETVRRCKERHRLMKEAVYARHYLAAAHSDYCNSLRLTGSALCTFAAGEPLAVSDDIPAVFVNKKTQQPPPPPPRETTVTTSKLPNISETRRRKPPPKLPHILSDSSVCSTPRSEFPNWFFPTAHQAQSTASETSSVWNWENFHPPPSPPNSEYFRQRCHPPNHKSEAHGSDSESDSFYNMFHSKNHIQKLKIQTINGYSQNQHQRNRSKAEGFESERSEPEPEPEPDPDRSETEREEVRCSDWEDCYGSTSSSDKEEEIDGLKSSAKPESVTGGDIPARKDEKIGEVKEEKVMMKHKDLKEIVEAIRENFEKAAVAGDELSEMLQISRAQLDRSFSQLKKIVYHSSNLLSNVSSCWTSKPPLAVKYRFDAGSLEGPGGPKSLSSTLDRLLAWEDKLCQEVKARECVKIEHEKKLSAMQSQEWKGDDEAKINKTKATITRLQSLIIVTSQAVSTTSAAIDGLRDSDLVPQLVQLCHGIICMWRSMHQYHETQSKIVQQVCGLVNRSSKGHSTSESHKQATRDLESALSAWNSSFIRIIKFQRDFILSLHGWFKLNLIPVNNDNKNNNKIEQSDAFHFCDEWKLALDRVPDTVASEAIKSFINVVHVISVKQCEELKVKKKTDTAFKELEKKSSSLSNIEKKFYNSYSMVGIGIIPNSVDDIGQGLDARDPLAEKKLELEACQRRVEDEKMKHSKAIEVTRAMTLNNLQTGLPGVFQALTSFSSLFIEVLESVCARSYAIK